jgi:hypothetical protein
MAYGIQIKNGSSETIIDENNPVLVKSSGGTSTYDEVKTASFYRHDVSVGQDDMFFVEINNGDIFIFSGVDWDDTINAINNRTSIITNKTSFNYFYAKDSNLVGASSGGYGMEIRDGSGGLVYNSNQELIPANGYTGSGTYSLNSGAAYVNMPFLSFSGFQNFGWPNPTVLFYSGVSRSNNQISTGCYIGDSYISNAPPVGTNGCTYTTKYTVIQR